MQKNINNRFELSLGIFVTIVSLLIMAAGAVFCYLGVTQIVGISDIDVNVLLREPADYMLSKRDAALGGLDVMIPGILLLLIGMVVFSVVLTRMITMTREGRAIMRLDSRVSALEKKAKK